MGFLDGLFKKKAGGSLVGNILRGVVNNASHGILGNGGGIMTQEQIDAKELNAYDFFAKYGYNPGSTVAANNALSPGGATTNTPVIPAIIKNIFDGSTQTNPYGYQVEQPMNKNLPWIIGGLIAFFLLFIGAKKMNLIK